MSPDLEDPELPDNSPFAQLARYTPGVAVVILAVTTFMDSTVC